MNLLQFLDEKNGSTSDAQRKAMFARMRGSVRTVRQDRTKRKISQNNKGVVILKSGIRIDKPKGGKVSKGLKTGLQTAHSQTRKDLADKVRAMRKERTSSVIGKVANKPAVTTAKESKAAAAVKTILAARKKKK